MNLSHTFLGEIFMIFHRKYLPFFRYLQKSFGKKYVLKKSQNSIFTRALSIKKYLWLLSGSFLFFNLDRFYIILWGHTNACGKYLGKVERIAKAGKQSDVFYTIDSLLD